MSSSIAELRERFPEGVALLDSIVIVEMDDSYHFVAPDPFQLAGMNAARTQLFAQLKQGVSWETLSLLLESAEAYAITLELYQRGLLIEKLEPWREGAQERQLSWLAHLVRAPVAAQDKLRSEHALVVGSGGTGGVVVQHLASIGVGALTLVDFDRVELSNFNRQLPFRRADIGSPKVEALREHVLERHPDCRVSVKQALVGSASDLLSSFADSPPSVIFCCADTPVGKINAVVARAAAFWNVPCVFGSVGVMEGAVGPLLDGAGPPMTHFIAAMDELGELGERIIGKAAMGASFSPVNTLIAVHMVLEWTKRALDLGDCRIVNQSVVFDYRTGAQRLECCWGPQLAPSPA